ncbi:MAG: hypothetical protein FJY76_01725 [Candidatus Aenigmarchaeota archaeon]|nr:hypothetical protein [Candidatus Aenigmarchaeota archaeon]
MIMKGQMIFEFVVATLVFIVIVFSVVAMLNSTVSSFTSNYYRNHINEEAMRVSELLVHSVGQWNVVGGSVAPTLMGLLGLAEEWPVLDDVSVGYLSEYCKKPEQREKMVRLLGLESRGGAQGFRIVLSNASQVIIDCSTGTPYLEQGYAERFAYTRESGLVRLGVYVW